MLHQIFTRRYILPLCYIMIIIVANSCERHEEVEDPCDFCCPKATGINKVTFKETNNNILQHLNFKEVNEPCYSMAYRSTYYPEETDISIYFNDYDTHDPEYFQTEPLFNGAISFEISLDIKDSSISNQYEVDRLSISFKNGYYASYESVYDTSTTIIISKYGDVWEKIEGGFTSTFINYNNNADTLIIDCLFSAERWCDR